MSWVSFVVWMLAAAGIGPWPPGPGGCLVRGQVVDAGGRPVADARLAALSATTQEPGAAGMAEAGPDGRLALRLPRGVYRWAVDSTTDPTTAERHLDLLRSCAAADLGRIALATGRELAGRVVGPGSYPLAGATLTIYSDPHWPSYLAVTDCSCVRPHRQVATDADGRFVLPGLVAGTTYDLFATAPGFLRAHRRASPGSAILAIALEPAARLVIEAVDAGGEPVAGAHIRLQALGESDSFQMVYDPLVTGDDGRHDESSLAPGELSVELRHPGYALGRRVVKLVAGETTRARFVLDAVAGSPVELLSVDEDGAPIAGVRGQLSSSPRTEDGTFLTAVSDQAGRISWPQVPCGTYDVLLDPPIEVPVEHRRSVRIEVAERPVTRRVVFAKVPGRAVDGQVVGPEGEPARGATVSLFGRSGGAFLETRVDGDGRFHFPLVPFGDQILNLQVPDVAGILERRVQVRREGREPWLLHVPAGAQVEGHLVLADGVEPRGGWQVSAQREEPTQVVAVRAWTEADLTYHLPPLAPGTWTLEARVETAEGWAEGRAEVDLRDGGPPTRRDLEVAFPERRFAITGRLRHRGVPLRGALVSLQGTEPSARALSARTGADGAFTIKGVTPGTYRYFVGWGGAPVLNRTVALDGPTDLGREARFARVRGRVEVAGVDPTTLVVRLTPLGPADSRLGWTYVTDTYPEFARPRTDGTFDAGPLEEGRWKLQAEAAGFRPESVTVTVDSADVEGLVLAAEREEPETPETPETPAAADSEGNPR